MTHYGVSQAEPGEVEANLLELWRRNLSLGCDARQRFDWAYRRAPEPPTSVYLLAATEAGRHRIVGTAGATSRHFHAGARRLRAALLVDLAVERWHRTLLPALTLVRHVRSDLLQRFDFAYGFPNRHARGVFRRAGHLQVGRVTRYACALRHARYLARVLPSARLGRVAAAPLDALTRAGRAPRVVRSSLRFRLEWLDAFDGRFDMLWREARRDYDLVAERSSAFLRWRFLELPNQRFRVAALSTRMGDLRAYAIVRFDGTVAHCHDLFGYSSDLGPLIDLLADELYGLGASSISLAFFGSQHVVCMLEARGFRPREADRPMFAGFPQTVPYAYWIDPERWHITEADEDS